ncbi:hypothetical protein A9Q86_00125 [Flavobacteriales bacterium 33_180_T64]|nr:hypothetical protein A9Q86_00125 [Flavobacteriales bacterium 33_180_T64]
MNTQCDDDDDLVEAPCEQTVIIDSGFYELAESDLYTLISVQIEDNCLAINVSASGCDSSSWSMVLVDSGAVAESSPEQRFLKFVFSNEEDCLAVFTQERSFDLSPLQITGSNEVILNIESFSETLTYMY